MPFRDGDATVTFEDVENIDRRPMEAVMRPDGTYTGSQEKSVKCRFSDGKERFVSRGQVPSYQEFPEEGAFTLEVSEWMVSKWEESDQAPREVVKVPDVVVLRASARAIQVRLPSGAEEWCPLKGIDEDSPVRGDGDRGELWVAPWCAKMKGWHAPRPEQEADEMPGWAGGSRPERTGGAPAGYEEGPGRAGPAGHGIGADARGAALADDDLSDVPF